MKYIALLIGILAVVPLATLLRSNPEWMRRSWFAIGLLAFLMTASPYLSVAVVAWSWPGHTYGYDVTLIDILALAIYLSQPRTQNRFQFRLPLMFYFLAAASTMFLSAVPMATSFYVWQLTRVIFLAIVTARGCERQENRESLINGMAVGLIVEMCFVLWQRFVLGIVQTPGTFSHQNFLGLSLHFAYFPILMLVLHRPGRFLEYSALFSVAVIVSMTASRATVGLMLLGTALAVALSISLRSTARKWRVALAGTAGVLLMVPLALKSFEARLQVNPFPSTLGERDERTLMQDAAWSIARDHPFGVGANMFVAVANTGGYYEEAGVGLPSRGSLVHNVFYLVLAETGYVGLFAFLYLMGLVIFRALLTGVRSNASENGSLSLGIAVGVFVVALHSWFEWVLITGVAQTFLALCIGMTASLAPQKRLAHLK